MCVCFLGGGAEEGHGSITYCCVQPILYCLTHLPGASLPAEAHKVWEAKYGVQVRLEPGDGVGIVGVARAHLAAQAHRLRRMSEHHHHACEI